MCCRSSFGSAEMRSTASHRSPSSSTLFLFSPPRLQTPAPPSVPIAISLSFSNLGNPSVPPICYRKRDGLLNWAETDAQGRSSRPTECGLNFELSAHTAMHKPCTGMNVFLSSIFPLLRILLLFEIIKEKKTLTAGFLLVSTWAKQDMMQFYSRWIKLRNHT